MTKLQRVGAIAAALAALAGCAAVDIDQSIAATNDTTRAFSQGNLAIQRTQAQREARDALSAQLLAQPLSMGSAVQLSIGNSPAVQALLAQSWADMARADQSGRLANPMFSFERVKLGGELELNRLLSFGLLDLLLLPQRMRLAQGAVAQARLQLAADVVDQVTQTRQAWVRAVAAAQSLQYAQLVNKSAQASAELARRMQQAGNFNKLQRARQQAFYADAAAQLATSQHNTTAAREALSRQLGLTDEQAARLKLPERLPDLPQEPMAAAAASDEATRQRLDIQIARMQLDSAGRAQGLNLLTSLIDVEVGARRDTVYGSDAGTRGTRRGYEAVIRLPVFDWGSAQRNALNAQSLAAANHYEAVARAASSQLRESYSAYRTAYDLSRHYRDEIVPLRKTIQEENVLRYNGMLIGVFDLLADNREQISSVMAAINAQQQFWLADAALLASLAGKPANTATPAPGALSAPASGMAH